MKDMIQETLNDLLSKNPQADLYQAVQAGITVGAVSMRTRAMKAVALNKSNINAITGAIGELSDIDTSE